MDGPIQMNHQKNGLINNLQEIYPFVTLDNAFKLNNFNNSIIHDNRLK
ncbi:MAG: hypothetical protein HeimC3_07270 [Candidatus Heimdallarchaeota archaeon LC_3]|nr:MAG: hypothetical protein HeimC3_07270 [Candidatus Heimdallarchaeota archaeon LC_3]